MATTAAGAGRQRLPRRRRGRRYARWWCGQRQPSPAVPATTRSMAAPATTRWTAARATTRTCLVAVRARTRSATTTRRSGKLDVVQLGAGVLPTDVTVWRAGDDLWLAINGTADSLRVSNYFYNDATYGYQVEQIKFADGTIWDVATVKAKVLIGTSGNDTLTGYAGSRHASSAWRGDDSICRAMAATTRSTAGAGDDTLYGDDGDDIAARRHRRTTLCTAATATTRCRGRTAMTRSAAAPATTRWMAVRATTRSTAALATTRTCLVAARARTRSAPTTTTVGQARRRAAGCGRAADRCDGVARGR